MSGTDLGTHFARFLNMFHTVPLTHEMCVCAWGGHTHSCLVGLIYRLKLSAKNCLQKDKFNFVTEGC